MAAKIAFNNAIYNSVDEMPPDVRQAYQQIMGVFADKNQNGVPDVFEGLSGANATMLNGGSTTIVYNGKAYNNVHELPPKARQKYEQAMGKLDGNRNTIPDFLEGNMAVGAPAIPAKSDSGFAAVPRFAPQTENQNIEPESTSMRFVLVSDCVIHPMPACDCNVSGPVLIGKISI